MNRSIPPRLGSGKICYSFRAYTEIWKNFTQLADTILLCTIFASQTPLGAIKRHMYNSQWHTPLPFRKELVFAGCGKVALEVRSSGSIVPLSFYRAMGVIVNNRVTPSSHIKNITSKASQRLFMIKWYFTGLTKAKLSTLYTSIIRPVID